MADREFYVGATGPLLFEDSDVYPDSEAMCAGRGPQYFVEDAPTVDEHVVRKMDLALFLSLVYPVGAVYFSSSSTNPNTVFGIGTWVQIAQGKFLVGQKAGDPDFGTGGSSGGSKTHTHKINPPSTTSGGPSATTNVDSTTGTTAVGSDVHTHDVDIAEFDSGDNSALPPYYVIYAWERTA